MQKTSEREEYLFQKELFRLSATLYSKTQKNNSHADVQLSIIKCIITESENIFLSESEILSEIENKYKYSLTTDEFKKVIAKNKQFFAYTEDGSKKYKLIDSEYKNTKRLFDNNIEHYICEFIQIRKYNESIFKSAIYRYLYELTTSNVNSYNILLGSKIQDHYSDEELSIPLEQLSDDERKMVIDFIDWNNDEKNEVLTNIVYCCLEYCLTINGDHASTLIQKSFRAKEFYLDTNILFRALGINGIGRQKVTISFLEKCKKAKAELCVIEETKKEFISTLNYYINLYESHPSGRISSKVIDEYINAGIYEYYQEWKLKHQGLSLQMFLKYAEVELNNLISKYKINTKIIPNSMKRSSEFVNKIEQYGKILKPHENRGEFFNTTNDSISCNNLHDTVILSYLETKRENFNNENYFLVSSDNGFRLWDMKRSREGIPFVIYPSQLFLILTKVCGRSNEDFTTFVNYINIRPRSKELDVKKSIVIISGISSITEDYGYQEEIAKSIFEDDFESIVSDASTEDEIYFSTQTYSKNYLERELHKKEDDFEEIERFSHLQTTTISELKKDNYAKDLKIIESNKQLEKMAEMHIRHTYRLKCYVLPSMFTMLSVLFLLFMFLQIFFCEKDWNIVTDFANYLKTTTLGQNQPVLLYGIDCILIPIIGWVFVKYLPKHIGYEYKKNTKNKLICEFIDKSTS